MLVSFLASLFWTTLGLILLCHRCHVQGLAVNSPSKVDSNVFLTSPSIYTSGTQPLQENREPAEQRSVFLFSLQWTPDDRISKEVRSLWKWKDSTLGDGRDFFVPKPKTLRSLQNYLIRHCTGLQECSILSNCARLEVLCTVTQTMPSPLPVATSRTNVTMENAAAVVNSPLERRLLEELSLCLGSQMLFSSRNTPSIWSQLFFPTQMDRPNAILNLDRAPLEILGDNDPDSVNAIHNVRNGLLLHWEVFRGPNDVLQHLCDVAAGMAPRPRRPDRTTLFRPFSSRDAHILLQLKRTKDIVSLAYDINRGPDSQSSLVTAEKVNRRQRLIPLLLEYALRAGKAVRNPNIVPEINLLREKVLVGMPETLEAVSISSSSFRRHDNQVASKDVKGEITYIVPSRMTELEKSRHVVAVARSKAIEPLIQECTSKLGIDTDARRKAIADLRARALHMVLAMGGDDIRRVDDSGKKLDEKELRWLKGKLHQPTIELRNEGELVSYANAEALLDEIREDFENFRNHLKSQ